MTALPFWDACSGKKLDWPEIGYSSRHSRCSSSTVKVGLCWSEFSRVALPYQANGFTRIEFFAEVGTGLGPTLEFYALVSKEFSRKDLGMWRNSDVAANPSPYVDNPAGLFPCPIQDDLGLSEGGRKVSTMFRVLGQFVAKGLMDSRIVDVPFNRTFMKLVLDHDLPLTTAMVKTVDPTLGSSLDHLQAYVNAKEAILSDISNSDSDKAKRIGKIKIKDASVDDLSLDFTLPGFPDIALKPNGQDISVTIDNVEEYVQLVIEYTLVKGTERCALLSRLLFSHCRLFRQVKAFRAGFSEVFPVKDLACFTADELVLVFGNAKEDWTLESMQGSLALTNLMLSKLCTTVYERITAILWTRASSRTYSPSSRITTDHSNDCSSVSPRAAHASRSAASRPCIRP
jgi:E3 ubiquitin-protein ligase TRIP12